ncbi:hypothetical protein DYI24_20920 [Rhodopseudomonas sp. BR0C11]|uniref:hypothetical protein n=1 Tax=Rhodopseudomonas sp. BR0C11 TaxID=2269370 RepID=UPI0013DFF868|nr:hypothetical protein [Rhodopseudomonas sp. BR0C11]NEV79502.1 hypothetical protein [Rhodopseudomonas sp. BR0C11]
MAETSYPFFRIARQFGVPYGQVLAYRDALLRSAGLSFAPFDEWERAAWQALVGTSAAVAIVNAIIEENLRRMSAVAAGGDRR